VPAHVSRTAKPAPARSINDVVPELARRLLVAPELPTRLPTVRQLAQEHRSSLASIHAAIGRLEGVGAIEVDRRGRLGAFLVKRAVGPLWTAAIGGPLVVSLPLASSLRYEALATAIKQLLTGAGLEVFLIYVRGSRQRLEAVRDGRCHLAAMSRFAASEVCGPEDRVVLELAPNSYNSGHRVLLSTARTRRRRPRVIVDRHSADQQLLTALEFKERDVEFVPAMTAQITRLLTSGQADAAVWTADEMQAAHPDGIRDRAMSPAVRQQIGDSDTCAVLVGRASDEDLLRAVVAVIDPGEVARIQAEVMTGKMVPEY
jgi:hypothetical protein